jgi:hypothetical protein
VDGRRPAEELSGWEGGALSVQNAGAASKIQKENDEGEPETDFSISDPAGFLLP